MKLVIATRQSKLALWQAEFIRAELERLPAVDQVELLGITTKGDRWLSSPLSEIGGKALFVKELEQALLDGRAHLCVHSMKDVPAVMDQPFQLACIGYREDPSDVIVSRGGESLKELPAGAIVGSSSLRRASQILHLRPDLQVRSIRGNVGTRLAKLDSGEFDAIVLAKAGLVRLELGSRITEELSFEVCLPSAGQGALGIEVLDSAPEIAEIVGQLGDPEAMACVGAERGVSAGLQADCTAPVAAHARMRDGEVWLRARVASPDGSRLLHADAQHADGERAAQAVVAELIAQGARELLA